MGTIELLLIAIGLAMDAFAVSICKGLSVGKASVKSCALAGLYFGGFQAIMPLIGYFLGTQLESFITNIDHWVAFVLLTIIGINMIRESRGSAEQLEASFGPKAMLPLAVATSIDALAIGITFGVLGVSILPAVTLIGIVTFVLSAVGVILGGIFGAKCRSAAELCGGIVLILIGSKILLEHVGIL